MSLRFSAVGVAVVLSVFHLFALAEELPVEAFSALPKVEALRLSPDGGRLAYMANIGDDTALAVVDLASGESTVVATTDNRKFRFLWQRWVGGDHLMFSAAYPDHRDGTLTTETRLLSAEVGSAPMNAICSRM